MATFRMWAITVGTVASFQAVEGLSPAKVAVILTLLVATVLGLVGRQVDPTASRLRVASLAAAYIIVSLSALAVMYSDADISSVLSDSTVYLMLLAAPFAIYDLGRKCSESAILRCAVVTAFIGAAFFSLEFAQRRALIEAENPGLASGALTGTAVALFTAQAVVTGRARWWWAATASVLLPLASGTRSSLLLMLIPAAIGLVMVRRTPALRRRLSVSLRSALVIVPIAGVIVVLTLYGLQVDVSASTDRLLTAFDGSSPQSLEERAIQHDLAWNSFRADMLTGEGPGRLYAVYRPTSGQVTASPTLDTSVVVLARWGLLGTLPLALIMWMWWRFLTPRRNDPLNVWSLTAIGIAPFLISQAFFGAVLEDKGLPVTLLLIGSGTVAAGHPQYGVVGQQLPGLAGVRRS